MNESAPHVRVSVLSGPRVGAEHVVVTAAVLGRFADCDLRLDDAGVSRHHARVWVEGGEVWLLHDVTKREQAERILRTEFAITRLFTQTTPESEAAPQLLQAICEGLDWDLGELWIIDPKIHRLRRHADRDRRLRRRLASSISIATGGLGYYEIGADVTSLIDAGATSYTLYLTCPSGVSNGGLMGCTVQGSFEVSMLWL